MFVVKEIEVHDGTVGGGVSSLLFLLASPRTEIRPRPWPLSPPILDGSVTRNGYMSSFLLAYVCSPNSLIILGKKSGKLDLRGGNLMMG